MSNLRIAFPTAALLTFGCARHALPPYGHADGVALESRVAADTGITPQIASPCLFAGPVKVWLFEHRDLNAGPPARDRGGVVVGLTESCPDLTGALDLQGDIVNFNDRTSSYRIGLGWKAEFFRDGNYQDPILDGGPGIKKRLGRKNDQISSVRITVWNGPGGPSQPVPEPDTREICRGTQVPPGWIVHDRRPVIGACGATSGLTFSIWIIVRYDNRPIGSEMSVCSGAVPAGWVLRGYSLDAGHCPPSHQNNVMTIRRSN